MGVGGTPILGLALRLGSWICSLSSLALNMEFWVSDVGGASGRRYGSCFQCRSSFSALGCGHSCRSCGRKFCRECMRSEFCRFCFQAIGIDGEASPSGNASISQFAAPVEPRQSSPASHLCSAFRSNVEDDTDDNSNHIFSPLSDCSQDVSDVDVGLSHDFYSFKSVNSSPLDSPIKAGDNRESSPAKMGFSDQEASGFSKIHRAESDDRCGYETLHVYSTNGSSKVEQPLNFENNVLIWVPPPPEDEYNDVENGYIGLDDEDDELGGSGRALSPCSFDKNASPMDDRANGVNKEALKSSLHGHFTALVSQLLKGEGNNGGDERDGQEWLETVCSLAWQAANFVRPDTSNGGSMDPGNYVKIKCMASGSPRDSSFIRGVVCTKNVKHKRMVSQHKHPRILILGGSLEYQKVPNTFASINTLLEQETCHLKRAVGIIQAHRPNVLLVEKTVSPYAQEYLLEKEISLVLNVKRSLLERISRCTGAQIVPSIDNLSSAKLGQCENFCVEKVCDDGLPGCGPKKNSSKTLMYFDGCPRRLGCTIVLRGSSYEELKKIKKVLQYACFAAYHLSLETSFLADEGATLPEIPPKSIPTDSELHTVFGTCMSSPSSLIMDDKRDEEQVVDSCDKCVNHILQRSNISYVKDVTTGAEIDVKGPFPFHANISGNVLELINSDGGGTVSEFSIDASLAEFQNSSYELPWNNSERCSQFSADGFHCNRELDNSEKEYTSSKGNSKLGESLYWEKTEEDGDSYTPRKFPSTSDRDQGILVLQSSSCIVKGSVCERSKLLRIKFYGNFDKPLGRYLHDDLFDQATSCRSCKEPVEAHICCFTHRHGCLRISVRRLHFMNLPGEHDGKIWMWHRCLKCDLKDGVPPATRRVVMSDAAWGLSFGKFLELSFSNHTAANRIAICGHSLQRDCLRFYGLGNMVAIFQYSPINILSVHLPPSLLNFSYDNPPEWVKGEVAEISIKIDLLQERVCSALLALEQIIIHIECESVRLSIGNQIMRLNDLLISEKNDYDAILQRATEDNTKTVQAGFDVLDLNWLRNRLHMDSSMWDHRLYLLELSFKTQDSPLNIGLNLPEDSPPYIKVDECNADTFRKVGELYCPSEETSPKSMVTPTNSANLSPIRASDEPSLEIFECKSKVVEMDLSVDYVKGFLGQERLGFVSGELYNLERYISVKHAARNSSEHVALEGSIFSDKIDSVWNGTGQLVGLSTGVSEADSLGLLSMKANLFNKKSMHPVRVLSFDSALKTCNKVHPASDLASSRFSSVRSFDASGNLAKTGMDTTENIHNLAYVTPPSYISEKARFILPQTLLDDAVFAIYDGDPANIISYAIHALESSFGMGRECDRKEDFDCSERSDGGKADPCDIAQMQLDNKLPQLHGSDNKQTTKAKIYIDPKEPHIRITFDDDFSFHTKKAKFSVTCYFAKMFAELRSMCCPRNFDYVRSLCRCTKLDAQGGKSNVYFAKSWDGRFIIKQMIRTELESFELFADQYFDYLIGSIKSGNPSCLAKVLGIYQVSVKNLKSGRESKLDLMVMENLFFGRNISDVYDLKGSSRARYNSDTSGNNKVMLDLNLLDALYSKPIYLGCKAKRCLERAIWNDTSFLASVDVMDYSLLVGLDEGRNELVVGIIDFVRQYTWDKHLESWVKSSGILGGPKNSSPTVISPMQYKKRFRKAMSKYFHTLPDHWPS